MYSVQNCLNSFEGTDLILPATDSRLYLSPAGIGPESVDCISKESIFTDVESRCKFMDGFLKITFDRRRF